MRKGGGKPNWKCGVYERGYGVCFRETENRSNRDESNYSSCQEEDTRGKLRKNKL